MKIRYHGYNAFVIEDGDAKVVIDPGRNLHILKFDSLIPKREWEGTDIILITHADPDHYSYAVPAALACEAAVACHPELAEELRRAGVSEVIPLTADDAGAPALHGSMQLRALKSEHGPIHAGIFGGLAAFSMYREDTDSQPAKEIYLAGRRVLRSEKPGRLHDHGRIELLGGLIRLERDNVDFARGSLGFEFSIGNKTVVNLGDTLLLDAWKDLKPDVLMLPIGGRRIRNTMDEVEAAEAVRQISPKLVIPCHYDCPVLFNWRANPADPELFSRSLERMGIGCTIMKLGDETEI